MVSYIKKATIWTSQNAVNKVLDELKSLYPKSYTYFEVHSFKYTLLPPYFCKPLLVEVVVNLQGY